MDWEHEIVEMKIWKYTVPGTYEVPMGGQVMATNGMEVWMLVDEDERRELRELDVEKRELLPVVGEKQGFVTHAGAKAFCNGTEMIVVVDRRRERVMRVVELVWTGKKAPEKGYIGTFKKNELTYHLFDHGESPVGHGS